MGNKDLDKFIEEFDDKLRSFEGFREDRYKESLQEQFSLAKRFYAFLLKPDGIPDTKLFDDIAMDMDADVTGWIVELPCALWDHRGMVDEAVDICNLFSEVYSPENFLGDMAAILAEAGRRQEAFDRISKNLEKFPDDAWIIIKAGQAYQTLKETEKAIELYNRAYGMTSSLSYDRDGVLERLVPLLRESGRDAEADTLVESEETAAKAGRERYRRHEREETNWAAVADKQEPLPLSSRKIGRNEPCPCGSGKKYKKCCLTDEDKNAELRRAISLSSSPEGIRAELGGSMELYRFKVRLLRMAHKEIDNEVSRIIEIGGKSTLYDLHMQIQRAFDWDNDHMFSFYLSDNMDDRSKEYSANPIGEHVRSFWGEQTKPAGEAQIRDLDLKMGMDFLYLFDYGDELLHRITVENISEITTEDANIPRITAKTGRAPDQYHY